MTKNNLSDTYDDICPVNDSGNHRYFIFKTFEVYEPYTFVDEGAYSVDKTQAIYRLFQELPTLYERVEYAISGCNCGSAIRQKVRQV